MLEEPPLLTIRRGFARPAAAQVAAMAVCPTGWIVDAQDGRASLGAAIKPIFPGVAGQDRCCGVAITCWCGPNDNLAIVAAMAMAQPGDVVVASTEGFGRSGVMGDLVAGMMRNRRLAGFVTDGCVRDFQGLRETGLPIFAAGLLPDSCVRSGPGTVGLPITIGGRRIDPGDIIVADVDGVTTVPLADLDRVTARLDEVRRAEEMMLEKVRGGLTEPGYLGELLRSPQVRYLD